jgi:TPR repeat protein
MRNEVRRATKKSRFERASELWDRGATREARRLFLKSAREGDVDAQLNAGLFYDEGIGGKRNSTKAVYWYHRAHRGGSSSAAHNLGLYYLAQRRFKRALAWLEKSEAIGNGESALELGRLYLSVFGDLRSARQHLRRAARSRHVTESAAQEAATLLASIATRQRR